MRGDDVARPASTDALLEAWLGFFLGALLGGAGGTAAGAAVGYVMGAQDGIWLAAGAAAGGVGGGATGTYLYLRLRKAGSALPTATGALVLAVCPFMVGFGVFVDAWNLPDLLAEPLSAPGVGAAAAIAALAAPIARLGVLASASAGRHLPGRGALLASLALALIVWEAVTFTSVVRTASLDEALKFGAFKASFDGAWALRWHAGNLTSLARTIANDPRLPAAVAARSTSATADVLRDYTTRLGPPHWSPSHPSALAILDPSGVALAQLNLQERAGTVAAGVSRFDPQALEYSLQGEAHNWGPAGVPEGPAAPGAAIAAIRTYPPNVEGPSDERRRVGRFALTIRQPLERGGEVAVAGDLFDMPPPLHELLILDADGKLLRQSTSDEPPIGLPGRTEQGPISGEPYLTPDGAAAFRPAQDDLRHPVAPATDAAWSGWAWAGAPPIVGGTACCREAGRLASAAGRAGLLGMPVALLGFAMWVVLRVTSRTRLAPPGEPVRHAAPAEPVAPV